MPKKKEACKIDPPAEGLEKVESVQRMSVWPTSGKNDKGEEVPVVAVGIDYEAYGLLMFGMPRAEAIKFALAMIRAAGPDPQEPRPQ